MKLRDKLVVPPRKPVTLADWDPGDTHGFAKEPAIEKIETSIARLDELQYLMYAEHRRALLVVLQGMDAAGKDGTIRHVMRGFNPQGCRVTAFKTPTPDAPWFIVPANKKWFRNLAVSHILIETLEALDMRFPKPSFDVSGIELA